MSRAKTRISGMRPLPGAVTISGTPSPVMSPIVAEIYGIDYEGQIAAARKVREVFEQTGDIIDIDDSIVESGMGTQGPADKRIVVIDREKATRLGVSQKTVAEALQTALKGEDVSFLHGETSKYAVPIRLMYSEADKSDLDQVLSLRIQSQSGALIPLSEIVSVVGEVRENAIYHKDLMPVVYVTADMAGELDSPLYGLFEISGKLTETGELEQWFLDQPPNPYDYSLKWDGEWHITYEVFRDLGIAFGAAMMGIYILLVIQMKSFFMPLLIMVAIPLTLIGLWALRRWIRRKEPGYLYLAAFLFRYEAELLTVHHEHGFDIIHHSV